MTTDYEKRLDEAFSSTQGGMPIGVLGKVAHVLRAYGYSLEKIAKGFESDFGIGPATEETILNLINPQLLAHKEASKRLQDFKNDPEVSKLSQSFIRKYGSPLARTKTRSEDNG